MTPTPSPIKITAETQPVFPCWIYRPGTCKWFHFKTEGLTSGNWPDYGWTHYHPDQPTAPTVTPDAPLPMQGADPRILTTGSGGSHEPTVFDRATPPAPDGEVQRLKEQAASAKTYWDKTSGHLIDEITTLRAENARLKAQIANAQTT